MDIIQTMQALTPDTSFDPIAWDAMESLFGTFFSDMRTVQQNPMYHGEGDVFTHTQMVCGALNQMPEFHTMPLLQKTQLFAAAALHDIGKVKTTRFEDGKWTSPHHATVGSQTARSFLWQTCSLCGTPENIRFRETVCALIRHHMIPIHFERQKNPEQKAFEVAAVGELIPDFSWEMLCRLSEADVLGRIAPDTQQGLDTLQLCRWTVQEAGCYTAPYLFADAFSRRAYLSGRNIRPYQKLYDDTWGEVVLMSGLPGTGKDTWIQKNLPELPMISLDNIRKELRIPSDARGSAAIHAAQDRARVYLRKKQPFVWNATNLSKEIRQNQIRILEQYGARVRIVYLETDWTQRIERNRNRTSAVPENAVEKMLDVTIPPTPDEAQTVEWITT